VCVCEREIVGWKKALLLCSVMSAVPGPSKNSLETLDNFVTAVCCKGCITQRKQPVPHSVCAEQSLRLGSTGQDIHCFYQILWIIIDDLTNLYLSYFQIINHKRHYFNPLKPQLNPIFHLLALLGTHHIIHVSRIRVNVHFNNTHKHIHT